MELGLAGKPALVMASSRGLGKGIATELAREGARVMLCSRSAQVLATAQAEIHALTGNRPEFVVGDVTRADDIHRAVAATTERFGTIYALVNNTGGPPAGSFEQFDDDAWTAAFELTLLSYVRAVRAVLPIMKQAGAGRILNNASSSIKTALDNLLLSNVFRMGIAGLAKSLARELGPLGILVNVIGAGKIATDRVDQLDRLAAQQRGIDAEQFRTTCEAQIPLRRYGTIEEFGKLAAFLCSPANTYVTGQSVLVDGGSIAAY
jgi:3-oxoacyl-[acyl-carrier protein] reductase